MRATRMRVTRALAAIGATAALAAGVAACGDDDSSSSSGGGGGASKDEEVTIGLITKTESNPFFVKMKEGAEAAAKEHNVKLLTASGKFDTDNASQVAAIENMTTQGAKVILDVPADSKAVVPRGQEGARRRRARYLARHADRAGGRGRRAVRHGQPQGRRADRPVREGQGREDGHRAEDRDARPRPRHLRRPAPPRRLPRRASGSRRATCRSWCRPDPGRHRQGSGGDGEPAQKDPDINIIYSINEPSGFGGATALKAAGKDPKDFILVSVDGGCEAIEKGIKTGVIDATSQQYPLKMASLGVEKGAAWARGEKPSGYMDTGVELITADPVDGVESKDAAYGEENCWG